MSAPEKSGVPDDNQNRMEEAVEPELEPMTSDQTESSPKSRINFAQSFAEGTSLPGIPRVILAESRISCVFWIIVCLVCASMFLWGLSDIMTLYFSYPKKVTVELVAEPVPFPSVTMCNMRSFDFDVLNRINDLFAEDNTGKSFANKSLGHPFIEAYMKHVSRLGVLWYSPHAQTPAVQLALQESVSRTALFAAIPDLVLTQAGIKLRQFIATCTLGGVPCDLDKNFGGFFHSYYFNCYTYHDPISASVNFTLTDDERDEESDENMPWLSPGLDNGLSMVVLTGSGMLTRNPVPHYMPGLYDTGSATAGGDGVRVIVHPPDVLPFPLAEGFDVPPGFSASIGIRPRRNVRIGPPHGDCIDENPFEHEAPVKSKHPYRQLSCQQLCVQQIVIDKCGCYDETLPIMDMDPNIPTCRSIAHLPAYCQVRDEPECFEALLVQYRRINCSRHIRDEVRASRAAMLKCGCRAACNEILYDVSYSVSAWPARGFEGDAAFEDIFKSHEFLSHFNSTRLTEHFNETRDRITAMRDFARINVYVADPEVVVTRESPEYDVAQLISDIGGQLGAWIGLSLITLAEVVELVGQVFSNTVLAGLRNRS